MKVHGMQGAIAFESITELVRSRSVACRADCKRYRCEAFVFSKLICALKTCSKELFSYLRTGLRRSVKSAVIQMTALSSVLGAVHLSLFWSFSECCASNNRVLLACSVIR